MTLMWVFQLCDELPMIGFSSFLAWSVFNVEPGYANSVFSMTSLAAIFVADLTLAYTYVRSFPLQVKTLTILTHRGTRLQIRNPLPALHQIAFGFIMLSLVARTSWLIEHRLPERERTKVASLYQRGALAFILGFCCWLAERASCSSLQAVRAVLGPTLGTVTELHAWWHLLTGYGTYLMCTAATLLVLSVKSPLERFEFVPSFGGFLPYVRRVDTGRKKV